MTTIRVNRQTGEFFVEHGGIGVNGKASKSLLADTPAFKGFALALLGSAFEDVAGRSIELVDVESPSNGEIGEVGR